MSVNHKRDHDDETDMETDDSYPDDMSLSVKESLESDMKALRITSYKAEIGEPQVRAILVKIMDVLIGEYYSKCYTMRLKYF
jgi:hypothetical protein